jgi:transposase
MADSPDSRPVRPATEVVAVAKRRQFSATYKRRILREFAACTAPGEKGALLRREGLYTSHLSNWHRLEDQGALAGLESKKRGPVAKPVDPRDKQLLEAGKALRKMTRRAERAEALVEVQKKLSEILGIGLPSDDAELD